MNLKKIGKLFTGKFVGTRPLFYEKRIYQAMVSQRLRNTVLVDACLICGVNHVSASLYRDRIKRQGFSVNY
jgi:hypothetical protein